MRHGSALRTALVATALALGLAGCAASSAQDPGATSPAPGSAAPELSGTLTVYAAASLQAAFDELAAQFEQRHPSLDVQPLTYDGSSTLATQIVEGAPADVFASADEPNMQKVVDGGLASDPELFATNTLALVVPADDSGGIDDIDDLADPDLTVVLCAAEVPCGSAARALFTDAGITVTPASEEQNVSAVLTKVKSGEADAGLVYVTDVEAAGGEVDGVEIENADAATNVYPISALADAANPEAASAFVEFVTSEEGRAVLASFGFGSP